MSAQVNEPVDPSSPITDVAGAQGPAIAGTIFSLVTRTLTGASGGSASGAYISSEHYNRSARGIRCYIVASGAATGTAQFKLQVIDPVSAKWIDLPGATTTALDGTGSGVTGALLTVYPGLTGIADVTGTPGDIKVDNILGPRWRGVLTVALSNSTCSVGADYIF